MDERGANKFVGNNQALGSALDLEHSKAGRRCAKYALWSFLAAAAAVACLMQWGGSLLISNDSLPAGVDAAVVLQGSVLGEKARVAGAVSLLQQGTASRIVLSVPKESYWGRPIAPIAYAYVEKTYGQATADRTDFCTTEPEVDSTEQEARALAGCIREHGWTSIAVVTSDYHTRRAGIIWRKTLRQAHLPVHLWIHGVLDPEFHAKGWWRERRSAKTWLMESTKLLWTVTVG
jgi:uncharacterized SAM-binding protein YcdF (DUF218 family)